MLMPKNVNAGIAALTERLENTVADKKLLNNFEEIFTKSTKLIRF